jgi:hypothetical protein
VNGYGEQGWIEALRRIDRGRRREGRFRKLLRGVVDTILLGGSIRR